MTYSGSDKDGLKNDVVDIGDVHSNRGNLALWTRSEADGSAVKDRPNPVLPIFSRPYLFRQDVVTQYLGFKEFGGDS